MQPIIPLQPNIPGGEGNGSAFILPDDNRLSAADALYYDREKRRSEKLAQAKQFQDQMLLLGKAGGKGLPNHRQEFAQQYQSILNWAQEQRLAGKNPYIPGTNENFELQRQMNDLMAKGTIMGETYDHAAKNMGLVSGNPAKYRIDKWNQDLTALNDTKLGDLNASAFPNLADKFDAEKHLNETLQRFPQVEKENPTLSPTNVPGIYKQKTTKGRDAAGTVRALTANPDYREFLLHDYLPQNDQVAYSTFAQLPEVKNAVNAFVKKSNGKATQHDINNYVHGLAQDKAFDYDHSQFQNNLVGALARSHAGAALQPSTTYTTVHDPSYSKPGVDKNKPEWSGVTLNDKDVNPEMITNYLVSKHGQEKDANGTLLADVFRSKDFQNSSLPKYIQQFQEKLADGKSGYASFSKVGSENKPLVLNGTSVTGGTFLKLGDKTYFMGGAPEMTPDRLMQVMAIFMDPNNSSDKKVQLAKSYAPEVVDLDNKEDGNRLAVYAGFDSIDALKNHVSSTVRHQAAVNNNNPAAPGKTISRDEYAKLGVAERKQFLQSGGVIK